jgi:hypothetical protein
MHRPVMSIEQRDAATKLLMRRSGVSFFTRRVLQRWMRGELSTDAAIDLIECDDAVRIVAAWRPRGE